MTLGKQWKAEDLALDDIREHRDFQFRHRGIDTANLNKIVRTLEAGGETRDPIRVARVGRVLYVVDGFHRLQAYRTAGRRTIPALVAKMGLSEARDAARSLNAMNGKAYSRADKEGVWSAYIAEGRHLECDGSAKPSRTISAELGGLYSYETIRIKLKGLGMTLDEGVEYPGGFKAWRSEEELATDMAAEAYEYLRAFGSLIHDLEPWDREPLLEVTRGIVRAAEKGERPDVARLFLDASRF